VSSLKKLDQLWLRVIGAADPVPYTLRTLFPERWVRFHSLPEAKRYAESSAEHGIVLLRHNAVLDELMRPAQGLFLVTTAYSGQAHKAVRDAELIALDASAKPWRVVAMHDTQDATDDPRFFHFSVSEWTWSGGLFDSLLRLVADDVIANVLMVSQDSGCVYHPYDGGADVILPCNARRDALRNTHREWLSDLSSGL